ncbi:virion core protein, T7 gp14 family [Pseudoduganella lutea]|uniref:Internal virion protein B n=1 Tax=Pseudoduganella lutea TaxID=321985 RepID=A0A4P6L581_9BURK|nr:hypothetical protein [Pseudoduganella lutea]QBE66836.1 hypothetical protein EWM63_30905 [Pseudoduganella lutea]
MLAITAVTTAASIAQQKKVVKAANKATDQQYESNMQTYRQNVANLEVKRNEQASDASDQINLNNRAAQKVQATGTVSAGEAGVAGTSVDALLRELAGQAGLDNTRVEENLLRENRAIDLQQANAFGGVVDQINSLPGAQMPDYAGAVLRIGQASTSAYADYQRTGKF